MGLIYKTCADGDFDEAYTCDPCFTAENGNVRSLVLIRKGTVIAFPLVKFDWELQVGLGNIFIMPETRGSFDGGTPKYITGYGSVKEKKVGDDYVLYVKDPNYVDNVAFYQEAEKHLWNIAYLSETQLNYVAQDITITAKAPIEEDLETDVAWNLELKWFSKIKPVTAAYAPIASLFLNDGSGFEYEVITGLSIASGTVTPQVVYLAVDADKTCKVVLPDNTVLNSTAGVINDTWAGAAGAVTLIVPNNTSILTLSSADFVGVLNTQSNVVITCNNCANLTEIIANNSESIEAQNSPLIVSIVSTSAFGIDATDCALTANAIAIILANGILLHDLSLINYTFSGGSNADISTWSVQAVADKDAIVLAGGTVGYNI